MAGEELPEKSPRRARFLRVAERRTREILHKVRLLGNCSNLSAYEYRPDEVDRIFAAIEEEVRTARSRFERRRQIEFRLR